jgi:DNA-binding HxlR family transcriptional regulator
MDISLIPDMFQSKIRLAIVSCLITGKKTFREIKDITGATDGNLSTHLSKMEKEDYIEVEKEFQNKKPRSTYILTSRGRSEFEEYVRLLEGIIQSINPE